MSPQLDFVASKASSMVQSMGGAEFCGDSGMVGEWSSNIYEYEGSISAYPYED